MDLPGSITEWVYYVLFIDEYSRFTWLYPIMNKSEVFQCFIKFKFLVENLFSTTIKYFQTDNGGEYTSTAFKQFLSQKWHFPPSYMPTHLSAKWYY
jgi:hypothetical protein